MYSRIEEFFKKRYEGWEGAVQFEGTGPRLRRMIDEMCWSPEKIQEELKKCFTTFEEGYSRMIVSGPTSVWTLCPHHLLGCHFEVYIGCIPDSRVLGLSKFSRVAEIVGRRPIMQETYSRELVEVIWENLKPKGVGVLVYGKHGCMMVRGIKQNANVVTSELRGYFLDQASVKEEFFQIVRGMK